MDYMMPGMDGLEATRLIRETGYKHPIIALTANVIKGREGIFSENGFDGHLFKPIDIRELNTILHRLIRDKQTPDVIEAARKEHLVRATTSVDRTNRSAYFNDEYRMSVIRDTRRAIKVLEEILTDIINNASADMDLFTTTIHGLKTPLIEMEEATLSETAIDLERMSALISSGTEEEKNKLQSEASAFIESLKSFVEKHKPEEEADINVLTVDDSIILNEKLSEMSTACDALDIKTAKRIFIELKEMELPRELKETINELSADLLRGDYDKVIAGVKGVITGGSSTGEKIIRQENII